LLLSVVAQIFAYALQLCISDNCGRHQVHRAFTANFVSAVPPYTDQCSCTGSALYRYAHTHTHTHTHTHIYIYIYDHSGRNCPLRYLGQRGRSFQTRYKEYITAIKHNKIHSSEHKTYQKGTLLQNTKAVIQMTSESRYMDSIETFHIYCEKQQNKLMNKVLFDLKNHIFDTIYKHNRKY
jgi:hypothetical protein